ncbi:MAG: hypothetical protein ACYTG7_11715 [Planctomycetota bacterium]|jgi:hypothetical protein
MKSIMIILLLLVAALCVPGCVSQKSGTQLEQDPASCVTVQEVIDKHFEALGGREKIEEIDSLILHVVSGSALLPPSEKALLYLKKPDKFKQEGAFRVVLCNGREAVQNSGNEITTLTAGDLDGMIYRIGFYHNAFSLLKWKDHFAGAKLEELKRYGEEAQYMIRFPEAENGHDLLAYIDAKTFLIDRLAYKISQVGAGYLTVVNQLRDYEEFEGIQFPTRVVFDKIGWETAPTHFLIREVEINPPIDDALFTDATIDFGTVACEGDTVRGEIRGDMDGTLLTNLTLDDLSSVGIQPLNWASLHAGDTETRIRVLENIQRSASHIKPDEIYLCMYPISGFPRLMLMGWGFNVSDRIPCEKGDTLVVTRIDAPAETKETEAKPDNG